MFVCGFSACLRVSFFFSLCLYFCMPQRQRELLGYERSCRAGFFFSPSPRTVREGGREGGRIWKGMTLVFFHQSNQWIV